MLLHFRGDLIIMINHMEKVNNLNEKLYSDKNISEDAQFIGTYGSCGMAVHLLLEGVNILCCHTDLSDFGWDDKENDYIRNVEEQVLFELEIFEKELSKVISAIKKQISL